MKENLKMPVGAKLLGKPLLMQAELVQQYQIPEVRDCCEFCCFDDYCINREYGYQCKNTFYQKV